MYGSQLILICWPENLADTMMYIWLVSNMLDLCFRKSWNITEESTQIIHFHLIKIKQQIPILNGGTKQQMYTL